MADADTLVGGVVGKRIEPSGVMSLRDAATDIHCVLTVAGEVDTILMP